MSLASSAIILAPPHAFRPHPVLGWCFAPGARIRPVFRDGVLQTIGPDGWRRVPGRPRQGRVDLCVYGCSFTFGTGLADEETFVAQLQEALPDIRLHNRGIGGHSTLQNCLQFRTDLRQGRVGAAIFAIISDHRFRNQPHPERMKIFLNPLWVDLGVEHLPVLRRGHGGAFDVDYVPAWQPAMKRRRFDDFLPDDHVLDEATFAVLEEVERMARAASVPLRFVLLDRIDPGFSAAFAQRFPGALDASAPQDEAHSFMPHDPHPNPRANRLFAQRILPLARALADGTHRSGG